MPCPELTLETCSAAAHCRLDLTDCEFRGFPNDVDPCVGLSDSQCEQEPTCRLKAACERQQSSPKCNQLSADVCNEYPYCGVSEASTQL